MSSYGQGSTRNWRRIRQQVLERDSYECQLRLPGCLFTATEVDHVVSIAATRTRRADADDMDMCRAICGPCHQRVTERQRRAGQLQSNAMRAARRRLPQQPHPGEIR